MARDLCALPRPHVFVEFATELRDLLANAFQIRLAVGASGKLAQILDVPLEALDLAFAASLRVNFIPARHHITNSIACAPQICRTDSISSAFTVTRCCECSTAMEPSGECNSKSTGLGPGEPANSSSN